MNPLLRFIIDSSNDRFLEMISSDALSLSVSNVRSKSRIGSQFNPMPGYLSKNSSVLSKESEIVKLQSFFRLQRKSLFFFRLYSTSKNNFAAWFIDFDFSKLFSLDA